MQLKKNDNKMTGYYNFRFLKKWNNKKKMIKLKKKNGNGW